MACKKHGYTNPTFCPACDVELIAQVTVPQHSQAWYEGSDACSAGLSREANPYINGGTVEHFAKLMNDWYEGYDAYWLAIMDHREACWR